MAAYQYPVEFSPGFDESNGWGAISPYTHNAFIHYVNRTLKTCHDTLMQL
jgi:hypothetical protein